MLRQFLKNMINGILRAVDPLLVERPLVSVIITTYRRPELLTKRAIPSVIAQTYQNFEIIVVGDHCEDDTEDRVKAINDPRIRFYNLAKRPDYPEDPILKWMVSGAHACNFGLDLARGEWITQLDDDDEYTGDHIEVLLRAALRRSLDFVYGAVNKEYSPGQWRKRGGFPPKFGRVYSNTVLYREKLRSIKYDPGSWRVGENADWNRWRRIFESGAKAGAIDRVVGIYHFGDSPGHEMWRRRKPSGQ